MMNQNYNQIYKYQVNKEGIRCLLTFLSGTKVLMMKDSM